MTNVPDLQPASVLAFGAHPDDVEIAAAGTLLRLAGEGLTIALVDFTRGEKATNGTPEERGREAQAAASRLGAQQRRNLGLPDCGVQADEETINLLVGCIRAVRPQLLLGHLSEDVHPDHRAAGAAAERAFFLSGLVNHAPELGAPWRPKLFLRFFGNRQVAPPLVVDIGDLLEAKAEVLSCYTSQLNPADRSHLVQGLDVLERAQVRDRCYGSAIGSRAAEPFWHDGPLPLTSVSALLGR